MVYGIQEMSYCVYKGHDGYHWWAWWGVEAWYLAMGEAGFNLGNGVRCKSDAHEGRDWVDGIGVVLAGSLASGGGWGEW